MFTMMLMPDVINGMVHIAEVVVVTLLTLRHLTAVATPSRSVELNIFTVNRAC